MWDIVEKKVLNFIQPTSERQTKWEKNGKKKNWELKR